MQDQIWNNCCVLWALVAKCYKFISLRETASVLCQLCHYPWVSADCASVLKEDGCTLEVRGMDADVVSTVGAMHHFVSWAHTDKSYVCSAFVLSLTDWLVNLENMDQSGNSQVVRESQWKHETSCIAQLNYQRHKDQLDIHKYWFTDILKALWLPRPVFSLREAMTVDLSIKLQYICESLQWQSQGL